MRIRTSAAAVLVLLALASSSIAQEKSALADLNLESLRGSVAPLTACFAGTVACGQTATGRVSVDSCESNGYYGVGYLFNGIAGTRVTINGRSATFTATVGLADGRSGNTTIYTRGEASSDGGTATIANFVLPYTGPYLILILAGAPFDFGDYTLSVTCETSTTTCTTTATQACLLDGRFRVSINYVNQFANPPAPGTFVAAKLVPGVQNPDVATFGISSAQAIEVVVRIQDTRPFGLNRFDVYYGGLTDLEYTVSVTDTVKGTTKTYRNPPGTVGGLVDRTTFTAN
ncbi:MAG TPA: hypothetical protein VF883_11870 [Thermoanaerobaculia bacterium]|jgi:hypothetical protein